MYVAKHYYGQVGNFGTHCSCSRCGGNYVRQEAGFMGAETFNAMSFNQWSQDEMNEELHGGRNMQFKEWLDDEVHTHGNIPLKKWGYEEEHDEPEHQHAETFNAETICPCGCDGVQSDHDDRGYGVWECPECGNDSDVDLGEVCSACWDKEILGDSYYEDSDSPKKCRECYGTGGLYDSHMSIDDRCRICGGTGYAKEGEGNSFSAEPMSAVEKAVRIERLFAKTNINQLRMSLKRELDKRRSKSYSPYYGFQPSE